MAFLLRTDVFWKISLSFVGKRCKMRLYSLFTLTRVRHAGFLCGQDISEHKKIAAKRVIPLYGNPSFINPNHLIRFQRRPRSLR